MGRTRKAAWVEHCAWPGCATPRYESPDAPPMCLTHLLEVATYIQRTVAGFHLFDLPRAELAPAPPPDLPASSVVYYVRLGDHVKIGRTDNLARRLKDLYVDHDPDALLAFEPGGADLEQFRHAQFAHERVHANRELFNPSRRLLAHIESLKQSSTTASS